MNRREIELQIRIVRVTYRAESRDDDSKAMREFRARAASLLDEVAPFAVDFPDMRAQLADVRRELGVADGADDAADYEADSAAKSSSIS